MWKYSFILIKVVHAELHSLMPITIIYLDNFTIDIHLCDFCYQDFIGTHRFWLCVMTLIHVHWHWLFFQPNNINKNIGRGKNFCHRSSKTHTWIPHMKRITAYTVIHLLWTMMLNNAKTWIDSFKKNLDTCEWPKIMTASKFIRTAW